MATYDQFFNYYCVISRQQIKKFVSKNISTFLRKIEIHMSLYRDRDRISKNFIPTMDRLSSFFIQINDQLFTVANVF